MNNVLTLSILSLLTYTIFQWVVSIGLRKRHAYTIYEASLVGLICIARQPVTLRYSCARKRYQVSLDLVVIRKYLFQIITRM